MEVATVYVTLPSKEQAHTLASALLQERLIACANIVDGMTSVYRWEGEIRSEPETLALLKTDPLQLEELTRRIRELHSYECPCIVAWQSIGADADYARWVQEETRP